MIVPIVFWGGKVPSHEITQICKSGDSGTLATGCKTGEICLWTFHKENKGDAIEVCTYADTGCCCYVMRLVISTTSTDWLGGQ